MIVTLSQISSTSDMSCELRRTVRPVAARRLISARMSRMPAGSRPLAGSSRTSSCGSRSRLGGAPGRRGRPNEEPPADLVVGAIDQVDDLEHLFHAPRRAVTVQTRQAGEVPAAAQVGIELRA